MLKFNPKQIFALRGIDNPTNFLVKMGFSYPQASKFLRKKSDVVKISHISRLCVALNCTPNDLFEWQADANTVLPESHSLSALEKGEKTRNLRELVKDIPADKLPLIESLLNELKS